MNPDVQVASLRELTAYDPWQKRPRRDWTGCSTLGGSAFRPGIRAKLPASAGPFFVAEYRAGEYVRLARNPHYWKKDQAGHALPYLDSVRIDIQQNRDIELARFLRGETQVVTKLDPQSFDRVEREKPGAARSLGASLDPEFLWFNQAPALAVPEWKRKWFTSVAFRHAVSRAIHRDDLARIVFRGHAHPAAGPISPANRFWFNAALKPLVGRSPRQLSESCWRRTVSRCATECCATARGMPSSFSSDY